MMQCAACGLNLLGRYKYVVVFARHGGRWLFCQHAARDTWEAPGGHVEPGETALGAARRELYEETGATDFSIVPVCDYWACNALRAADPTARSHGQVFFATVKAMGPLPAGSEMARAALFDALPDRLTYPDIARVVFPLAERVAQSGTE